MRSRFAYAQSLLHSCVASGQCTRLPIHRGGNGVFWSPTYILPHSADLKVTKTPLDSPGKLPRKYVLCRPPSDRRRHESAQAGCLSVIGGCDFLHSTLPTLVNCRLSKPTMATKSLYVLRSLVVVSIFCHIERNK